MSRKIAAVVAGLFVWLAVVTVAGIVMRVSWPAYAAVADAMTFTLTMLIARLSIGAVATIVMGVVTAVIVPQSLVTRLMPAVLLIIAFIPQHIRLWDTFPIWYHLVFFVSLVPFTHLGGSVADGSSKQRRQSGARVPAPGAP